MGRLGDIVRHLHGEQLVVLHQDAPGAKVADSPFSVKEIADYRDQNHTLQGVAEHHAMSFLLIGKDTAERVETAVVSANFFDVLGVKPLLGRTFVAADEKHGAPAVLILSYKYWQSHHGGDPNIVGKVFQMNDRQQTVIGVLPHVPKGSDVEVVGNLRDSVGDGGLVVVEARNQLFALFTFNRYTYELVRDELDARVAESPGCTMILSSRMPINACIRYKL